GGFTRKVATLKRFEDCYVRAQYEIYQMGEDARKAKSDEELEKARKARIATIMEALKRGLSLKDPLAKKMPMELANARAMLTYWALNSGELEEAIKTGEAFAREDPRASQASMAAVYALQAYSQLLAKKQAAFDDTTEDRAALFRLAAYMEDRWPAELPGELARHAVGLQLMKEENFPEPIKKLATATPASGSYAFAPYELPG